MSMVFAMTLFAGSLAHAAELLPRTRYTRNGGIRFLRFGQAPDVSVHLQATASITTRESMGRLSHGQTRDDSRLETI